MLTATFKTTGAGTLKENLHNARIGFYTDMHHTGATPLRRKDNFPETVRAKHDFILSEMNRCGCDVRLHGGDYNETPIMANSVLTHQMEIFKRHDSVDEWTVIGNHDVIGNNSDEDKVRQYNLGPLLASGIVKVLSNETPLLIENGNVVVGVMGINIHKDMDNLSGQDYYVRKPGGVDILILVAHGWVRQTPIGLDGVRHTTFEDIIQSGTEADIILTGHDHGGHEFIEYKGKYFYNPGSPVRVKAAEYEMERQVGFAILDIYADEVDDGGEKDIHIDAHFIPIPESIAKPAEEVLDRESLLREIEIKQAYEEKKDQFSGIALDSINPRDMVMRVAKIQSISEEARKDLIDRIDKAEAEEQRLEAKQRG